MKKKLNNNGSTMVEVLVSFTVLMIITAGLMGIIKVSSNLVMESKDLLKAQDEFTQEYYKTDYGELEKKDITGSDVILEQTDKQGNKTGVSIVLDHAQVSTISEKEEGSAYTIYRIK